MKAALILALLLPLGAMAQGFQDEPTCYAWSGGAKSSGAFSKCPPTIVAIKKEAPPVAVPVALPPPVLTSPIMMPQSAPQVISCAPLPKPVIKAKPKPKPQC